MKRFLVLMAIPILCCFKCDDEITYKENRRLSIKGTIITNENPETTFPIEVYASRDSYIHSTDNLSFVRNDALLGLGASDANGNFEIVALSPRNARSIYVLLNVSDSEVQNQGFSPMLLNNVDFLELQDNTYNLGLIIPDRTIDFRFRAERATSTNDTLSYKITYSPKIKTVDYALEYPTKPLFQRGFSGMMLPSQQSVFEDFEVRTGDLLRLSYELKNGATVVEGKDSIIVNANTNEFTFTF
ncbi:MAG: hypothetical protein AAGF77_04815 [Bacteroidota bacterium]